MKEKSNFVGTGVKRLRSKLYAEQSEAARLSLEPIFKNSNFSKEEFSDTSSVPKTLFIYF